MRTFYFKFLSHYWFSSCRVYAIEDYDSKKAKKNFKKLMAKNMSRPQLGSIIKPESIKLKEIKKVCYIDSDSVFTEEE